MPLLATFFELSFSAHRKSGTRGGGQVSVLFWDNVDACGLACRKPMVEPLLSSFGQRVYVQDISTLSILLTWKKCCKLGNSMCCSDLMWMLLGLPTESPWWAISLLLCTKGVISTLSTLLTQKKVPNIRDQSGHQCIVVYSTSRKATVTFSVVYIQSCMHCYELWDAV